MKFKEDKFVNGEVVYLSGQVYEIPEDKVARWLIRGGEVVETPVKKEEPKEILTEEVVAEGVVAEEKPKAKSKHKGK